jgi:hypothetical protein
MGRRLELCAKRVVGRAAGNYLECRRGVITMLWVP